MEGSWGQRVVAQKETWRVLPVSPVEVMLRELLQFEGSDPVALTPPSLSGEGYELSLSLESVVPVGRYGNPIDRSGRR